MKKAGFTLIELIFVIVILGILAAVAVPKFAATRDDAKFSKAATDVATVISDFGSYYTSQGQYKGADIANITNVKLLQVSTNAITTDGNSSYEYSLDGSSDCIRFSTTNKGELQIGVARSSADGSALCSNLQDAILGTTHSAKTYKFGGIGVKY